MVAVPVPEKEEEERKASVDYGINSQTEVGKTELEEKLESILESVEGVGKVQVLLMAEEEKDSMGFTQGNQVKVSGVLIAAEGADDFVTVQNIQEAVMALFQVEAHKIKVMKMK